MIGIILYIYAHDTRVQVYQISIKQLYLQQMMYDQNIDQNQSESQENTQNRQQLISIRKKLVAPNNLLPSSMIRSQLPQHILSIKTSAEFVSGSKLPLDDVECESDIEGSPQLIKTLKSKRFLSRQGKMKSKSELPEYKKKQQYRINDVESLQFVVEDKGDTLTFLNKNIKNIFSFKENIVFISQTAFISNVKTNKYKSKNNQVLTAQQIKNRKIHYLKNNRYFGVTSYAFDQPITKDIQENYNTKAINEDQHLQFSDQFESSNLYIAMKCDQQILNTYKKSGEDYSSLYLLTVRLDYNTKSYGQWFYFKVKRKSNHFNFTKTNSKSYKFMIINMTKNSSLFGKGLKISVCRNGVWGKQGKYIKYYKNSLRREQIFLDNEDQSLMASLNSIQNYYTLEFTVELGEGEEIYISYNEPYSYSRMGKFLDRITQRYEKNSGNSLVDFKRNVICQTFLNNHIEVLTFSAKRMPNSPLHLSIEEKKVIFIMGRTHPIQTAGSHVIEGILNQLYSLFIDNPQEAHKHHIIYRLLQEYIIKIIPMVNPDGVILGNSRCNLIGYDLNRCWKSPKIDKSKEILYIKRHIFQYKKRIQMFIDLHAHSKKKNVFAYGCHDINNPFSTRQFPFLLSKLSQNDFLFQECKFTKLNELKLQVKEKKSTKDGTARVFLYDSLRIPNIFTIQNSYCSAKNSIFHYDRYSYGVIGADILKAIALYFSPYFKQNSWQQQKQIQNNNRLSKQSHIKISLNTTHKNEFQFKITINSDKKVEEDLNRYINPNELRQKYLFQLRQKEENIKIGLAKDNEVSQSEEEERIFQKPSRTKEKNNSQANFSKKAKGQSKTDRLVNYLNKTTLKQTPQNTSINKKSVLNTSHISSTHSEANLAQIVKVKKDKFHTLSKKDETILIPDEICHENYSKDRKRQFSRRQRMPTQLDLSKREKTDTNCLSIVQIGMGNELQYNLIEQKNIPYDRFQGRDRLKTFHNYRQQRTTNTQISKKIETKRRVKQKDQQIKEYLRKLIKPKELIDKRERNERLFRLHQRSDKMQQKMKQSYFQFNDLRMSKLVILQNNKKFRIEGNELQ